jgi:hypothetical protein
MGGRSRDFKLLFNLSRVVTKVLLNSSLKKAPHNGGLPVSEQPTDHAADQSDWTAPAATAIVAGITRAAMAGGFVAETCRRLRDVFA